jgi:hypothetical protein
MSGRCISDMIVKGWSSPCILFLKKPLDAKGFLFCSYVCEFVFVNSFYPSVRKSSCYLLKVLLFWLFHI